MKRRFGQERDLTEGTIWKQLLLFFFPLWCGMFFQTLYSTADAIIVGQLVGSGALAAVGNTSSVTSLYIGLFNGLAAGATVLTAQYFGARDMGKVRRCAQTALFLAAVAGVVLMAVSLALAPWLMRVIDTPEDILQPSVEYLQIYSLGMLAMSIYNMGAGILRGLGDSQRPVIILVISSVCNIGLDLLLVIVFHMGIAGVAIATTVSQIVSAAIVLVLFFRRGGDGLQLKAQEWKPDPAMVLQVLRVGIPSAIQSTSYSFTNLLIQAGINSFGTATVAAWTTYGKVDILYWLTLNSMSNTLTTFVGQNYGAQKRERMTRGLHVATGMTAGFTVAMSGLMILFCRPLFRIFTSDLNVIEIGREMVVFLAPCYILFTVEELYSGTIRATGDAFWPMVINLFSICVVRVLWVLFVLPFRHTVLMLCVSYPISWALGSVLFLIYYKTGRWDRQRNAQSAVS